jgi:hypothetical protein
LLLFGGTAVVVGPDLEPRDVDFVQTAPGVYERELGEIDPGAYAVRISQTRPGDAALGRTVGLVAPTASEYRLLGPNEAFLATLRAATGGRAISLPAEPWTHDLETTSSFTPLWPLLLVLALLLWPLDIALRRVSIGRRELADARRWVGERRWRRAAARPVGVEGMLAIRDRAAGASARAAILRTDSAAGGEATAASAPTPTATATPRPATQRPSPAPTQQPPAPSPATPPSAAPGKPAAPAHAAQRDPASDGADTLARLREAKKRARG